MSVTSKTAEDGATTMSLVDLENGLRIDEHALDEALVQQPDLFYRVSKQLALLISRRDAKKQELAEEEAKADAETRETALKRKDKVTEAEVKSMTRLDPGVIKVSGELLHFSRLVGELSALKEAFQQRSYVLKDLVGLYVAGYYGSNQDGSSRRPNAHNILRQHQASEAREVLRARREHYGDDGRR
jgi:hypothetical protein